MIHVKELTDLQHRSVECWHRDTVEAPETGFKKFVLEQHRRNYALWHEEDIARSPDVSDVEIAGVKRRIDRFNQERNDHIEKLDAAIIDLLAESKIVPLPGARLNTETPGSAIDRLSIMSLRIYHMQEQMDREDASAEHREGARAKRDRCLKQHADLSCSLTELLEDLFLGLKVLKVYHQFKMYNDPTMNPYLYNRPSVPE